MVLNSPLKIMKRELGGNWVNFTLAKTSGTVTGDREKKLANSRKQMWDAFYLVPFPFSYVAKVAKRLLQSSHSKPNSCSMDGYF